MYETKQPSDVSWLQALPSRSLELIASTSADTNAMIINIGGSDAMLVDALLDRGYRQLCPRTPLRLTTLVNNGSAGRDGSGHGCGIPAMIESGAS